MGPPRHAIGTPPRLRNFRTLSIEWRVPDGPLVLSSLVGAAAIALVDAGIGCRGGVLDIMVAAARSDWPDWCGWCCISVSRFSQSATCVPSSFVSFLHPLASPSTTLLASPQPSKSNYCRPHTLEPCISHSATLGTAARPHETAAR